MDKQWVFGGWKTKWQRMWKRFSFCQMGWCMAHSRTWVFSTVSTMLTQNFNRWVNNEGHSMGHNVGIVMEFILYGVYSFLLSFIQSVSLQQVKRIWPRKTNQFHPTILIQIVRMISSWIFARPNNVVSSFYMRNKQDKKLCLPPFTWAISYSNRVLSLQLIDVWV